MMRMKRGLRAVGGGLVAMVVGCAGTPAETKPAGVQTVRLTASDTGRTVTLAVGDTLEIVLKGNPTTGYRWVVRAAGGEVLQAVGEPAYQADSAAVGAGGTFTFRFKAVKPGQGTVALEHRRPWEKDAQPEETFSVTVKVGP